MAEEVEQSRREAGGSVTPEEQPGPISDGNGEEQASLPRLVTSGRLPIMPHRLSRRLHLPQDVQVLDPRFFRYTSRYLLQSGLAALAMLAILLFVDSLADAALVAGLGSSVLIVFMHPSGPAASARSLIGGHSWALVVGSGFALLMFSSPVGDFLSQTRWLIDPELALSVGLLILIMAVTDTEHAPAAGTVLGISMRPWSLHTIAIIIAAVLLLAALKFLLRSQLRDLI